jgi:gluconate 2-dehydrogenase gamma chain
MHWLQAVVGRTMSHDTHMANCGSGVLAITWRLAMNRRDVLKLSAAVPAAAVAQHQHPDAKKAAATPAGWKPTILTADQAATMSVLADLIIPATDTPGAKEAGVIRYVDAMIKEAPAQQRDRFLEGVTWLDDYATKQNGKKFVALTPAEQTAILTTLDEAKPDDKALQPGAMFFRMAKGLIAQIYYQTAIGHRELNKGSRVPKSFGCAHQGKHAG